MKLFRQCSAVKKDGQQCQRPATQGEHCYSHRNCKPKRDYSNLDPFQDLHIEFSGKYEPTALCAECGAVVHEGISLKHGDEEIFVCIKCGKFELEIEDRISEVCSYYPGGVLKDKIIADLARFGVPEEKTELIRKRMIKEGRLAET